MTECRFPANTAVTAYGKSCRCERCRAAMAAYESRRIRRPRFACKRCGVPVWHSEQHCVNCCFPTPIEKVVQKIEIDPTSGCWLYRGRLNNWGYGYTYVRNGSGLTHRITYEAMVGPIPDGLQLDHLCNRPACCNPEHLEPVTAKENSRRARERRGADVVKVELIPREGAAA